MGTEGTEQSPNANRKAGKLNTYAILTLLISRKIYTIIRRLNPGEKVVRFTQLRWGTVFSEKANYLLADVLEYLGLDTSFITSLRISFSEALDPHVNRRRYTEEWWA